MIYGAYAIVTADHGKVSLVKQDATSSDIKKFSPPIVQLPAEQAALYTDWPAEWPTNVNLSPDFPIGAKLIRDMDRQTFGVEVDGVVATDPVALSEVLEDTGRGLRNLASPGLERSSRSTRKSRAPTSAPAHREQPSRGGCSEVRSADPASPPSGSR